MTRAISSRFQCLPISFRDAVAHLASDSKLHGRSSLVLQYEALVASSFGYQHAIAASSGTLAIETALRALDVGPNATVAVPALCPVMTILPILILGATPVALPMRSDALWVSDEGLDRLRQVDALLTVDWWGYQSDRAKLASATVLSDIPWIADSSHCHGTTLPPKCPQPTIEVFSTHDRKLVTTGEGGFLLTNDLEIARRSRSWVSYGALPLGVTELVLGIEMGTNAKLSSVAALLGISSLEELRSTILVRQDRASRIIEATGPTRALSAHPSAAQEYGQNSYGLVFMQPPDSTPFQGAKFLAKNGIQNDVIDYELHALGALPLFSHLQQDPEALRSATNLAGRLITVSPHGGLSDADCDYIGHVLADLDRILANA